MVVQDWYISTRIFDGYADQKCIKRLGIIRESVNENIVMKRLKYCEKGGLAMMKLSRKIKKRTGIILVQ